VADKFLPTIDNPRLKTRATRPGHPSTSEDAGHPSTNNENARCPGRLADHATTKAVGTGKSRSPAGTCPWVFRRHDGER